MVDGGSNQWKEVEDVISLMEGAKEKGNILVHCCGGMSRSPFVALCYMVIREGQSLTDSHEALRKGHKPTKINPNLLRMLAERLESRSRTSPL